MSEQVILAIVAILASTVGALIYVIKYMFDKILPILESLKASVDLNTEQTMISVKRIESNEIYLRKRNGSDSVRWKENTDAINSLTSIIKKTASEEV
jgi:hypothetical protein